MLKFGYRIQTEVLLICEVIIGMKATSVTLVAALCCVGIGSLLLPS